MDRRRNEERRTPFSISNFVTFKFDPKPVGGLIGEYSSEENLCNWPAKALRKSSLGTSVMIFMGFIIGTTCMSGNSLYVALH